MKSGRRSGNQELVARTLNIYITLVVLRAPGSRIFLLCLLADSEFRDDKLAGWERSVFVLEHIKVQGIRAFPHLNRLCLLKSIPHA
jgi:hypothetical protein